MFCMSNRRSEEDDESVPQRHLYSGSIANVQKRGSSPNKKDERLSQELPWHQNPFIAAHQTGKQSFTHHPIPSSNSREFYFKLIGLENKISKGNFILSDITALVAMYAKCIEFFDAIQDPIKCYFEDKISSTLSTTSVLSVLLKDENHFNPIDNGKSKQEDKVLGSVEQQETEKEAIQQETAVVTRVRTQSQQKKIDRVKVKHNMNLIKVSNEVETMQKNKQIIDNETLKVQNIEQNKQRIISKQKSDIEDRLRSRKERKLFSLSNKLLSSVNSILIEDDDGLMALSSIEEGISLIPSGRSHYWTEAQLTIPPFESQQQLNHHVCSENSYSSSDEDDEEEEDSESHSKTPNRRSVIMLDDETISTDMFT